ncbi:hypothetical protein V2J09_018191 [Rumex salicifolius]
MLSGGESMEEVRGVILDASALLLPGYCSDAPSLCPGADSLLRILQFSQLRLGISYDSSISNEKVNLLRKMSIQDSFECFFFCASSPDDVINGTLSTWGDIGGSILYLTSKEKEDVCTKLCSYGLNLAILNADGARCANESSGVTYIRKLEELPQNIIRLNKKAVGRKLVTVGYLMKPSRRADFAKRGAFPMHATQNGLIFLPITYELEMPLQLLELDVVLHKATDEIISIDLTDASTIGPKVTYTSGLLELRRSLEQQHNCCVIDPFDNVFPVLDRLETQNMLLGITEVNNRGPINIRAPHFLKVDNFGEPNFKERISEAMLSLPNIVKPRAACGVADAHSMAIVFRHEDYGSLSVPVPAIEYVDHSSTIFKIYVLGSEVFYSVKKSTPNANVLMNLSQPNYHRPLLFDSLKSLPTSTENHSGDEAQIRFDFELVKRAAKWLQKKLEMTIFGFDVVVEEGTTDHVIVDVNYLPSFKEVPDDVAIPAFWQAIKSKFEEEMECGK